MVIFSQPGGTTQGLASPIVGIQLIYGGQFLEIALSVEVETSLVDRKSVV